MIEPISNAMTRIALELSEENPDEFQRVLHWLKDASRGRGLSAGMLSPESVTLLQELELVKDGRLPYEKWGAVGSAIVEDAEQGVHRLRIQSLYDLVPVNRYQPNEPRTSTNEPDTAVSGTDIWERLGLPRPRGKEDDAPGGGIGY